jgi:hypothetical protein
LSKLENLVDFKNLVELKTWFWKLDPAGLLKQFILYQVANFQLKIDGQVESITQGIRSIRIDIVLNRIFLSIPQKFQPYYSHSKKENRSHVHQTWT